jgi:hypothetical protein
MSTPKSVQPAESISADTLGTEHTASLDPGIQGALGRKLRESYQEVVREEVPDKFLQLLDQLKKAEKEKAGEA